MVLFIGLANVLFRFVFPIKPAVLISGNMEPTYNKGDVIFYINSDNYEINDIIMFKSHPTNPRVDLIVSRIINISSVDQDIKYTTKGDNVKTNPVSINSCSANGCIDETSIQKDQINGKILFGTKWFIFYPLLYGIQIILALLLTKLIYSKLKK